MSVAAGTDSVVLYAEHQHRYGTRVDVTTASAGTYTHSYRSGTNMETGEAVYGECIVTRVHTYYNLLDSEKFSIKNNPFKLFYGILKVTTQKG